MAGFTPITLTGHYTDAQGNALDGDLTFTLSGSISNNNVVAVPLAYTVSLVAGAFSITLYANNDLDTVPQGTWYNVTEKVYGAAAEAQPRDYSIMVPYNAPGGTIDMSQLVPGTPMGFDPTTNNPSGAEVWSTYIDSTEAATWLQFSTGFTVGTEQATLFQRVIDAACVRAQMIANRPLCPTTFYERHDGWAGEYIQLDYSPFIRLISCLEWQSVGGFINLPESTPESPTEGIQINYHTSRIMRAFQGYSWPRPFFPGSRNIEVVYVAGINPVPPDVWEATVDLIAYWWRNTQQSASSFVTGSEEYGGPAAPTGLWPGVPNRIADVFESYRMVSIG